MNLPPQNNVVSSARCAALLAAAILGMASLRAAVNRTFGGARNAHWTELVAVASALGLLWFVVGLYVVRSRHGTANNSAKSDAREPRGNRGVGWPLAMSIFIALVMALSAYFALYLNDEIWYSRLLPWIGLLIGVQYPGFHAASRLSPCQKGGFNTGCEAYKWIPAFLLADTLAYLPFVTTGVLCYMYSKSARSLLDFVSRQFIRWSPIVAIVSLFGLLIMHGFGFDVWNFQYPGTDKWYWHSILWNAVSNLAGMIVVIGGFLLPFHLYLTFRWKGSTKERQGNLSGLTSLTIIILAALMLGYVY